MTKPYYSDDQVTLYCGDFRELLPDVLATHGEPDLVLTDPPYGETSLKWDRWPTGWPALMPGRSMWCFGSMRMFLDHRDEYLAGGWKLSQDTIGANVVWEKHNGSGFATDRFSRVHEHATHWYRGDWGTIYHDTPRIVGGSGNKNVANRPQPRHTGKIGSVPYVDDGLRLARSVIYAQSMHGTAINETEKPAGLVEQLLTYGCPPGGLVLDVFAGGCSTLVAARNSGRRAIGIELREDQCAKAVEWRLAQTVLPFAEGAS
jgi:site-specific DNA-methyltransferase (adenine-specific)